MREIPDKIDSKFRFVLLAANRAEHMMQGALPKIDDPGRKPSRLALDEIEGDLVEWGYGPAETVEGEADEADSNGE